MAQAFNFETRELCPYREDWNRGGNVKICGALWYIKERDGIYLLQDKKSHPEHFPRPYEPCISRGLPAAILAQGDALVNPEFNFDACYQAYFKIAKELFPTKPAYHIPTIFEDWEFTLGQAFPYDYNLSGFLDNLSMISVAGFLQRISNYYRFDSLVQKISHNYYYTFEPKDSNKPKIIFSQMPSIEDGTEAPLIYAHDIGQHVSKSKIQADGFIAAVINLAIFYHWQKRWSELNFTDSKVIEKILNEYKTGEPIVDIANLQQLPLGLPDNVEDICRAYMEAFLPIMEKTWKVKPTVQLECVEGDNIYSYIYMHEASSVDTLLASELYANLSDDQRLTLYAYCKRFLEWLKKNYPITTSSHYRIMQAMSKDLPPIQVTIHNDTKIIRAGEQLKEDKPKFIYILSNEPEVIDGIHKRIELYLSSPAKLRDELRRLQEEKLVSLPIDNPTNIIREIRRIWGDEAPKERSFVTTWGRVKC